MNSSLLVRALSWLILVFFFSLCCAFFVPLFSSAPIPARRTVASINKKKPGDTGSVLVHSITQKHTLKTTPPFLFYLALTFRCCCLAGSSHRTALQKSQFNFLFKLLPCGPTQQRVNKSHCMDRPGPNRHTWWWRWCWVMKNNIALALRLGTCASLHDKSSRYLGIELGCHTPSKDHLHQGTELTFTLWSRRLVVVKSFDQRRRGKSLNNPSLRWLLVLALALALEPRPFCEKT